MHPKFASNQIKWCVIALGIFLCLSFLCCMAANNSTTECKVVIGPFNCNLPEENISFLQITLYLMLIKKNASQVKKRKKWTLPPDLNTIHRLTHSHFCGSNAPFVLPFTNVGKQCYLNKLGFCLFFCTYFNWNCELWLLWGVTSEYWKRESFTKSHRI